MSGANVEMRCTTAGDESGDTLAALKNTYLEFRTDGQDPLGEDIVACLVPGVFSDNPANETLHSMEVVESPGE